MTWFGYLGYVFNNRRDFCEVDRPDRSSLGRTGTQIQARATANLVDNNGVRALSIRQPYVELILRGVKPIEFRSFATRIIGERFYIYASKWRPKQQPSDRVAEARSIWSDDLAVPGREPGTAPPKWMLELAELLILDKLPRGLIVGTATIAECRRNNGRYEWHLADVKRLASPRMPRRRGQPSWFHPY